MGRNYLDFRFKTNEQITKHKTNILKKKTENWNGAVLGKIMKRIRLREWGVDMTKIHCIHM